MKLADKLVNPVPDYTPNYCGLTYREWLIGQIASNYNLMQDSPETNAENIIYSADAIIEQLEKEKK